MAVSEAEPACRACAVHLPEDPSRKHQNGVACGVVLSFALRCGPWRTRVYHWAPPIAYPSRGGHLALSLVLTCSLLGTHVPSRKNRQSIAELDCQAHSVRLGANCSVKHRPFWRCQCRNQLFPWILLKTSYRISMLPITWRDG